MREWIQNLKPGDMVIVRAPGRSVGEAAEVSRTTPTRVVLLKTGYAGNTYETPYVRTGARAGQKVGGNGIWGESLEPHTKEAAAEIALAKLRSRVKAQIAELDLASLTHQQLTQLQQLIKEFQS
jgi:hypothetical protein